jgi:hypothetical protein
MQLASGTQLGFNNRRQDCQALTSQIEGRPGILKSPQQAVSEILDLSENVLRARAPNLKQTATVAAVCSTIGTAIAASILASNISMSETLQPDTVFAFTGGLIITASLLNLRQYFAESIKSKEKTVFEKFLF